MPNLENLALRDETVFPDENVLKEVLGNSYEAYCEVLKLYDNNLMDYGWRYYKDGKMWLCKVQKKKKTIVWMSIWKGYVQATIYIHEKFLESVYNLEINNKIKEKIRNTKNTGKSKPCTFIITDNEHLRDFNKLMQFKTTLK